MATKKTGMTENSRKVLDFLQKNGVGVKFTYAEVAKELGLKSAAAVVGSITGLKNKGCADTIKEDITLEDGKTKKVAYFWLTEKGATYNPDEAVSE